MIGDFEICDVLVIGLGPAGAMAAKECAKAGFKCIAIDSKPRAGFPVQCAEFVPSLLTNETMAAFHQSKQLIDKMVTFVENDPPDEKVPFSGRIIDREAFDSELVDDAIKCGAKAWFSTRFIDFEAEIAHLNNGRRIKARIIIGADGPHSMIGAKIGQINSEVLETRQISVALTKPISSTDIFLSSDYVGGYAWLFPKNDICNLGLGLLHREREKLKPLLNQLHQKLINQGRVGAEILGLTGGAIPVGGMLKPFGYIGKTLALLAGDAAGLTNPITGAGIPAAVISGQLAGEAAINYLNGKANASQNYHNDLKDMFGIALKRARGHFLKLLEIHKNSKPNQQQLRNSWIAYDEYWHQDFNIINWDEEDDMLEA